ncbi:hypothetical protein C1646_821665 [Rhizophagus diaphanus]|nr:hypothetical protein C1646_821665 [Rhizophagus diaphanus] [Rhizophagus sp. MUCL 43196]
MVNHKDIEFAQVKVIKTALQKGRKYDNLAKNYGDYLKKLTLAVKIFPKEEAYTERLENYRKRYEDNDLYSSLKSRCSKQWQSSRLWQSFYIKIFLHLENNVADTIAIIIQKLPLEVLDKLYWINSTWYKEIQRETGISLNWDVVLEEFIERETEIAKKQVEIERYMLHSGMLGGQKKEIVKYNIQQIAKNVVPWWDVDKWEESEFLGFTSKLHNMKSLDDIIEDVNKNIKKVFLVGVAPEFRQEVYIIGLKLTLDRLAES